MKKTATGVEHALSTILADYRNISNFSDICANYVVDKLPDPSLRRLDV